MTIESHHIHDQNTLFVGKKENLAQVIKNFCHI